MGDTLPVTFIFPMHTRTPGNGRRAWYLDATEAKAQRQAVRDRLLVNEAVLPAFPPRVTITRIAQRRLDKWNLPGALKHVIDGLADAYGIDDRDERWDITFRQAEAGRNTFAVQIDLEAK